MALGQHLKELRGKKGLSQAALAGRVGIDVTYLSKLENDRQRASEKVLRDLAEQLGVEPNGLMVMAGRLPSELRTTLIDAGATDALAPPRYRTTFVDRQDDQSLLKDLLTSEDRKDGSLISVTGPPGCGKTRLLAEVMAKVGASRPVAWITVRENESERIAAIPSFAGDRPDLVLVLDDAERDLDACTATALRMVDRGITVVATSRQPLRVYGHRHVPLTSLSRPDRHLRPAHGDVPAPVASTLHEQESVRLFVERARLAVPDFRLDGANAPAVFDVCRWLDGLPLAIELAALRLGQMTVADLAARTGSLLTWLGGNAPDVPDRHDSLASAIGWSFDRLDERRRTVATRLSLFESTFSLDDAVSVAVDERHSSDFVEATVMDLVDHSLIVMRANADRRAMYRWLSPVRQYSRHLLERSPDHDQSVERYRSWVRQVVATLDVDLPRREAEWERLAELTPELVSVVYELPAAEQADAMSRMADMLSKTVQFGNLTEHIAWFTERFGERTRGGGAEVLRQAGMLARVRGELDEAHRLFEQAHRIAVTKRDEVAQANTALDLAENAADRGGAYEEAAKYAERAAELYDKLEDNRGRIEVLNLRGKLRQEDGDLSGAETLFTEALELARRVEDRRLVAYSLHSLGVCDYLMRRITSARSWLEESLRIRENMRNQRGVARVVEALALVESAVHNPELVLRLLGAAGQYRRSSGVRGVPPWWRTKLEQAEQEARISLVAPDLADHYLRTGASMTVAEAGELAAQITMALPAGPLGDPVSREPLRRPIPSPHVDRGQLAAAVAAAARDQGPTALDLGSGASAADAYRRLHRAPLLALAEPIESRTSDLLCFAMDPHHHRGVIVPVFASGRALAEALDRHQEWVSRPVVEIRLEQLRASLGKGETAVVNPWTPTEFRISSTEHAYAPSAEESSSEAPAPSSRAVSSS